MSFHNLELPSNAQHIEKQNSLIIIKQNWKYDDCLKFQESCVEFIQQNKDKQIFILCSHPHCFTLGRGNERGDNSLIEFDVSSSLPFELYKIHRGGGITFHHPGQWILYPIVSINKDLSLDRLMCFCLKSTLSVMKELYKIDDLIATKKIMGIWHKKRKCASIGVGLKRFVSMHGLALNLSFDQKMQNALPLINPCGLNAQTYISCQELTDQKVSFDDFSKYYIERFLSDEVKFL